MSQDLWPQNDENTLYIESDFYDLEEIINQAKEKWPNVNISNLEVSAEHIHTSCLNYDLYDPSDWTNFIVIRKIF